MSVVTYSECLKCNAVALLTGTNMDHSIKPDQYEDVLRNFDRKKEREQHRSSNTMGRNVAANVGGETPLLVLMDIRDILSSMSSRIEENNNTMRDLLIHLNNARDDDVIRADQRHKESLAYMQQIADRIGSTSVTSSVAPSVATLGNSMVTPDVKNMHYYRGTQIKSPEAVVGCVLMHIEMLVSNNVMDGRRDSVADAGVMDVDDWASAVRNVRKTDSYKLMTMASYDTKHTLDIVATTVQGRPVTLQIEHLNDLCNKCPSLMTTVDEIRKRLIKCPGLVTPNKTKHLSMITFPYTTNENQLNLSTNDSATTGSPTVIDRVKTMKKNQRDVYALEILKNGKKPMQASIIATK